MAEATQSRLSVAAFVEAGEIQVFIPQHSNHASNKSFSRHVYLCHRKLSIMAGTEKLFAIREKLSSTVDLFHY